MLKSSTEHVEPTTEKALVAPSQLVRSVASSMRDHRSTGAAAELAFRYAHSLLWFVIFACVSTSTLSESWGGANLATSTISWALAALPPEAGHVLADQFEYLLSHHSPWLTLASGIGWVLTSTAAFMAMTHHLEITSRPQSEDDCSLGWH